jgi:hypothetical protein
VQDREVLEVPWTQGDFKANGFNVARVQEHLELLLKEQTQPSGYR